jgi:hypothetical protein
MFQEELQLTAEQMLTIKGGDDPDDDIISSGQRTSGTGCGNGEIK